jgi:hypothetical protein
VPINDGAGLLNGLDYFERTFPTSKAAMEAADEIERLRTQLEAARKALDIHEYELVETMRDLGLPSKVNTVKVVFIKLRAALQEN